MEIKEIEGKKHEPYEALTVDVPEEYMGPVMEKLGQRKAELLIGAALGSVHKNQAGSTGTLGKTQCIEILTEFLPLGSGIGGEALMTAVETIGHEKPLTQLLPQLGGDEQTTLIVHFCREFTDHTGSPPPFYSTLLPFCST